MNLLDIKGFKHLDKTIIVTNKLAETLKVETILAVSKNKEAFQTSVNVAMGMETQPYKRAEYETDKGLSYHIINPEKTKAYKIYHYDKNNSVDIMWHNTWKQNKTLLIGHPKFVQAIPEGWNSLGYHIGDLGAVQGYYYIMFDSHIGMCELKPLYLREVFGELGT